MSINYTNMANFFFIICIFVSLMFAVSTSFETHPFNKTTPIFFNLFVKNKFEVSRVRKFVNEQISFKTPKHGPIYMNSFGVRVGFDNVIYNFRKHGNEKDTLHDLFEYCSNSTTDDSLVVYLHSKGSFTPTQENDRLRVFLTRGALSTQCLNLPKSCNVCSSRMSPLPHPHTSGNMWLARCSYIKKLIDPLHFDQYMRTHIRRKGPAPCQGFGRFSSEHWVHSHPTSAPCDLYTKPDYVWNYDNVPRQNFEMELRAAPRFPLKTYMIQSPCSRFESGLHIQERLIEYQKLYNQTPPTAWWGWNFF